MWPHGLRFSALGSEVDRVSALRNAFQNAIRNTPVSALRALQMPKHECEAARWHVAHPNCKLRQRNHAT